MSGLKKSRTYIINEQIKFNLIIDNEINSSFEHINITCKVVSSHKLDIIIGWPDKAIHELLSKININITCNNKTETYMVI